MKTVFIFYSCSGELHDVQEFELTHCDTDAFAMMLNPATNEIYGEGWDENYIFKTLDELSLIDMCYLAKTYKKDLIEALIKYED